MNLASLRNIEDTDGKSDVRISELIATPSCRLACVVQFQLWNSAYKDFALYVAICARSRGVVGGVPSHFGKEGSMVCIGTMTVIAGLMAEVDKNEFAPSLRSSVGDTVA